MVHLSSAYEELIDELHLFVKDSGTDLGLTMDSTILLCGIRLSTISNVLPERDSEGLGIGNMVLCGLSPTLLSYHLITIIYLNSFLRCKQHVNHFATLFSLVVI